MNIRAHREPLTTFNTISLTDIIFLLLVFFLLSSTFVLQPGIKIQLPATTTRPDISSEKSIVISLTKEGAVYLNDNLVNRIELGAQLRQKVIDVGNPIIVLRADRSVLLEGLIDIMDIAKTAGADRFVIATAPKE
ncbi:MAG: biopolymer transporter ExbD [Candidatus Latescibacteria bacterium]|nr:biopolymer transporter ExbD [Candidatus Latescibacterota bacterium]